MLSLAKISELSIPLLKPLGLYQSHQEYDNWYQSLKRRNKEEWQQQWQGIPIQQSFFLELTNILSLPTPYLYPSDKLSLILYNRFADLSDVEALLYIEDQLGITINTNDITKDLILSNWIKTTPN